MCNWYGVNDNINNKAPNQNLNLLRQIRAKYNDIKRSDIWGQKTQIGDLRKGIKKFASTCLQLKRFHTSN